MPQISQTLPFFSFSQAPESGALRKEKQNTMTDPKAIVPYYDPHDTHPSEYDFQNLMADQNPTLLPSPLMEGPSSPISANIAAANDPFDDPMMWDISGMNMGNSNIDLNPIPQNQEPVVPSDLQPTDERAAENEFDTGKHLPIWPTPPEPYLCTCCQILREIIHTSGTYTTKLEIHGRLGIITHAILESRDNVRELLPSPQYHMFDFCKKSLDDVKEFLRQYCEERTKAGYIMLRDPLSDFYEAMCVGFEWFENRPHNCCHLGDPSSTGEHQTDQSEEETDAEKTQKSFLARQRERAAKLTIKDLEVYFHLPIEEAARRMNLCPTVVKKICRRCGVGRWPHRKVKSLQRQIASLGLLLNSADIEERERAQAEIHRLQEEMANLCAGNLRNKSGGSTSNDNNE